MCGNTYVPNTSLTQKNDNNYFTDTIKVEAVTLLLDQKKSSLVIS